MRRAWALRSGCACSSLSDVATTTSAGKDADEMKYQKRLNDNLDDAPTKGLLQQELIYVRPPKGLTGPTKTFSSGHDRARQIRPRKQLYRPGETSKPSRPGPAQEAQGPAPRKGHRPPQNRLRAAISRPK